MLGRRAHVSCPDCEVEVPAARWCNWCGAVLAPPPEPATGHRLPPFVVGGAIAIVAALVVVDGVSAPRVADVDADAAVVLAEDARPAPTAAPGASTEPRTDVVCSDLRRRSVPTRLLDDTEPGALAQLSWGPCVVIGPEGATLP